MRCALSIARSSGSPGYVTVATDVLQVIQGGAAASKPTGTRRD